MKRTFNYIQLFTLMGILILTSCQRKKIGFFSNSYTNYASTKSGKTPAAEPTIESEDVSASITAEPVILPKNTPTIVKKEKPVVEKVTRDVNEIPVQKNIETLEKKELKKFKKEIKRELKKSETNRTGIGTLLLVIIAILLPPLAVLLVDGLKGPFWLSILLTLLFYVPGLIYALWRVFRAE